MSFLPLRSADDRSPRFIGIDLAKRESQLAVLDATGQQIASRRFATNRDNLNALARELTAADCVALEVTTNSYAVARLLSTSPARLILSNPIKTRVIAEAKIKTDKIDARVLAELARVEYLPPVWLPDPDTEAMRHLFADRRSLVDRRTELKNTLHSILHRNLIVFEQTDLFGTTGRSLLNRVAQGGESAPDCDSLDRLRLRAILLELDRLELSVQDLEGVLAAFVSERPKWRDNLDRLLTIPGVSLVVGTGLLAAIGDVSRFKSAKHLASYFGLVPSTYQSGDAKARHGRITKRGRSEARWLAVEAAEHLRKAPGPMRALYTRVCGRRGHNVAIVAVARKLSELVWQLLSKQQDYLYQLPLKTQNKRSRVRFLARKQSGKVFPSAKPIFATTPVLYGSGLSGIKVKTKIAKLAAQQAEGIYAAVVAERQAEQRRPVGEGFDPTRPQLVDWQKVMEQVARQLAGTLPLKRYKPLEEDAAVCDPN
jgi:transposase